MSRLQTKKIRHISRHMTEDEEEEDELKGGSDDTEQEVEEDSDETERADGVRGAFKDFESNDASVTDNEEMNPEDRSEAGSRASTKRKRKRQERSEIERALTMAK